MKNAAIWAVLAVSLSFLASFASAATMTVSPASRSVSLGDKFTVDVLLDTQGTAIDGLDIRYLNFNPALLQMDSSVPGDLMPITNINNIDNTAGTLIFSQVVSGGTHYTGAGKLLTATFTAIAEGTAQITFNFTAGSTTDSNVAAEAKDILTLASGATITISKPAQQQTTTETQTATPSNNGSMESMLAIVMVVILVILLLLVMRHRKKVSDLGAPPTPAQAPAQAGA